MRRFTTGWLLLTAVLGAASSMAPVHAADDTAAKLQHTLQERFPKIKVDLVQPSPVPGVYEVIAGEQVAYSDATGDYLFTGRLMDTRTKQDLSAQHLDAHNSIDFSKLPLEKAIRIVKGNGQRKLAIFEDPDCPFCHQLEDSIRPITDVTLYVFLFPLESLHPGATTHAHAIWCSPDPSSAWTDWMQSHKEPSSTTCAGDPIGQIQTLAESMHIHSTPTLFLQNGHRVGGAIPREELQKLIEQSATTGVASLPASPSAPSPNTGM